jgi:xylulokinase
LVLLDERGEVLRAAKLERHHRRAQPGPPRRADRRPSLVMRIGTLPTAAFTIAKLAWVAEHEPGLLDRVATILLPHDYLTFWLTGEKVTDRSKRRAPGTSMPPTDSGFRPIWRWRQGTGLVHKLPTVLGLPTRRAPYGRAGRATRHRRRRAGGCGRRRSTRRVPRARPDRW